MSEGFTGPETPAAQETPAFNPPVVRPRKPRIWTVFVLPVAVVVFATVITAIMMIVGIILTQPGGLKQFSDMDEASEGFSEFLTTPFGLAVMLFPQLIFFAAALFGGLVSPQPLTKRLGLLKPQIGLAAILAAMVATPFFGMVGFQLMMLLFGGPSAQVEEMSQMFTDAQGPIVLFMAVGISVFPGISEELLFRGYVQQRLLQRWTVIPAIVVSSLLFAGAHIDPAHSVAVIPLGLWLGTVAWMSGSIWPAMACHTTNNLLSVILSRMVGTEEIDNTWDLPSLVLVCVSGGAMLLSIYLMRRDTRDVVRVAEAPVLDTPEPLPQDLPV